ncbi:oxidoreductase [Labilithrix luteola]|uniref:Oxidoreductase n=1 Tax=Labilithrix luteola TaxID=1391654 RepID=A0A0K1PUM8_9BACT|nr:zinc-binding dehydrogenase [Labilithrix luteola]AKU97086.1 oxidoreductase [Labilithrix luteola]
MRSLVATHSSSFVTIALVPEPTPAPDEVLVEVEAFSLNRPDLLYLQMPHSTFRPGIDFTGRVVKAAADGSGPPVGAFVLAHSPSGGGAAERVAVSSRQVVVRPESLSVYQAAALPLAGLVALRLVREAGPLEGKNVLVTGVTGGVGHYVVELAVSSGARVFAFASPEEPTDRLRELGAVLLSSLDAAPGLFDVVMESVGGELFSEIVPRLAPNSLVLWFGEASGKPIALDFFHFFPGHEAMTLRHFVYTHVPNADDRRDLEELVRLVIEGRLHPEIGRVSDWSEASDVFAQMQSRNLRGKAVLTV